MLFVNMGFDILFLGKYYLSNGVFNNKLMSSFLFKNLYIEDISDYFNMFEKFIELV